MLKKIVRHKVKSEYDIIFTSDTPDHNYHIVKNTKGMYHHFVSEEGARAFVLASPYGSAYLV